MLWLNKYMCFDSHKVQEAIEKNGLGYLAVYC